LGRATFVVDAVRTCAEGRAALSTVPYDAAISIWTSDGDGMRCFPPQGPAETKVPIIIPDRSGTRGGPRMPASTAGPMIIS